MTAYALWMSLGFCSGYIPGDPDMTRYLCDRQFEASLRIFDYPKIPNHPDRKDRKRPVISKEFREYA